MSEGLITCQYGSQLTSPDIARSLCVLVDPVRAMPQMKIGASISSVMISGCSEVALHSQAVAENPHEARLHHRRAFGVQVALVERLDENLQRHLGLVIDAFDARASPGLTEQGLRGRNLETA